MPAPSSDPLYEGPAAEHIQNQIWQRLGYQVLADRTLRDRLVEVDQGRGIIRVLPGQTLIDYHSAVGMSALWIIGGDAWVPDFRTEPRLRLVRPEDKTWPDLD